MLDRDTIKLTAALADAATRKQAATALSAHLGCTAIFLFVEDVEVDALLPAPGLAQTIAGGPTWRSFLDRCRESGIHRGEVAHPSPDSIVSAIACAGSSVAVAFVGCDVPDTTLEPILLLLPLLGSTLRAEQAASAAAGEMRVAREDARHAAMLARSLDSARADLERQAKSLNEARTRAEEAIRTKDEFLAMLGHELRNPLAPIMTALQLMRMKGTVSREQEIIERQVGHLVRLVDDLMDVARIARGRVELRKERLELAWAAARAIEIASPLLEQRQQFLTVDIPSEGLVVDADADRLAQILSNLLTNAAKYSDPGTEVAMSARRLDDTIVVRVRDQGQGIEPDMLDKIFDRFVQQRQSPERARGGLGLGLAIVKNLATLHGGSVRALSEGRGKGSEFVVELPASTGEIASTVAPTAAACPGEHDDQLTNLPNRILIVDDNEDAAKMLSDALTGLGYIVRTAGDGPSALVVAEEFVPQVALLDIGLPVMDGYELGRRLRESYTTLRLVALTGYGQASDKARSGEAGFDAHLVKPINLAKLRSLLADFSATEAGNTEQMP